MDSARIESTKTGRRDEPRGSSPEPSVWKLRVVYAADGGIVQEEARSLRGRGPLTIGRCRPDAGRGVELADERVSREHARICLDGSAAFVEDLGSKNGTDLNGRPLRAGERYALADGDVLRVGDSFLVVRYEPRTVADASISSLVGVSQAARALRSTIARFAPEDCTVLLSGATGTGKGAAAAAIHTLSRRPGKFVDVNCATVPATLAEGLFFGVKKGVFTGAVEQAGFFAESRNGTLFLDEIGELPIDVQPKLLQTVETKHARPLGPGEPIPCNARIIAATNRDLATALRAGSFREDLYHRLADIVIHLPPLRERREDVLLLAAHLHGSGFQPSPALVSALLSYPFPGNVRELAKIVFRVRAHGEATELASLTAQTPNASAPRPGSHSVATSRPPSPWTSGDPPPTRDEIVALLTRYHGSLNRIEAEIGYSRRQFGRWIEHYGIDLTAYRGRPEQSA